jgi:hypothetical protein
MSIRPSIAELLEKPGFTLSDDMSDEDLERVEEIVRGLEKPAEDEEAEALVRLLSRSDDLLYGLNQALVPFIESAPSWPIWSVLEECEGEWPDHLRQAALNAGFAPPA